MSFLYGLVAHHLTTAVSKASSGLFQREVLPMTAQRSHFAPDQSTSNYISESLL